MLKRNILIFGKPYSVIMLHDIAKKIVHVRQDSQSLLIWSKITLNSRAIGNKTEMMRQACKRNICISSADIP
jgi:hypothetical protein